MVYTPFSFLKSAMLKPTGSERNTRQFRVSRRVEEKPEKGNGHFTALAIMGF
jgi:hypothetical protein